MQIRCFKCQMPIALGQDAIYAALDITTDGEMNHYDVRCPRCRKTNRVSVDQLKHAAPGWQRQREEKAE
jgi:phage FluMu protein Com